MFRIAQIAPVSVLAPSQAVLRGPQNYPFNDLANRVKLIYSRPQADCAHTRSILRQTVPFGQNNSSRRWGLIRKSSITRPRTG
jgi:hypothetical protein